MCKRTRHRDHNTSNESGENEGQERENVVADVAVDRARERGRESVEELERTEVELDLESSFVQCKLPRSRQSFHILVRFDETPAFVLDVHLPLQGFRAIPRVGDDDTLDVSVCFAEELAISP